MILDAYKWLEGIPEIIPLRSVSFQIPAGEEGPIGCGRYFRY